MSNLYKERETGEEAQRILNSEVWQEAWDAYRSNILALIEGAKSNDTDSVMHLKRLLSAASACKGHLERLVKEGAVAVHAIDMEEKRGKLRKLFG